MSPYWYLSPERLVKRHKIEKPVKSKFESHKIFQQDKENHL